MNSIFWRNLTGAVLGALAGIVSGVVQAQTPIELLTAPGTDVILTNQPGAVSAYRWFHNGAPVVSTPFHYSDPEQSTLVITECSTNDTGRWVLRSGPDLATNAVYDLSVRVIEYPTNIVVNLGGTVQLPGGGGAHFYQWFKDGSPIGSKSNVFTFPNDYTLIIENAQQADTGTYELQCGIREQLVNARFNVLVAEGRFYISDLRWFYSKPYLLDFNFFLRDENDRAITNDPSLFDLTCWEDDQYITNSVISPTETGRRLLRANKQLDCFVVLDYTRSMVDPVRNGDADGDSISDSVENMEAGAKTLMGALPKDAKIGLFEVHRADASYPPQKVADLTRDKAYLTNQIDRLWSTNVWTSGASRCWDALYLALQEWPLYNLWDDQRFIVFLSDGRDESSTHFPTNVVSLALTNNVKIYCIGYGTELNPAPLIYVTSETGGQYYPARSADELLQRFQQIAIDMRSQYIVRWATLKRALTFPPFPPDTFPPDFPPVSPYYYFIPKFELSSSGFTTGVIGYTNRPGLYEGDELVGRLHFATSQDPGDVASLVLRADYIPRGVTRLRVNFATVQDFTIERIPFSEGGVCPDDWTFTTNLTGEVSYFEFSSPTNSDPFSALPFAALGKLVEFKLRGVTNLNECFTQMRVDNSFYSWPGGPTLVIDNAAAVGGEQIYEKDVYYVPGATIFLQVPGDDGTGGPYQWSKDGTDLQDSSRIQGSKTNSLVIQNCGETDSGSYILTGQTGTKAIFRVHVLPTATETIRLTNAPGVPLVLTNRSEVSYNSRWSRYGFLIYDTLDGRITGSGTPTLRINECSQDDSGVYVLTSGSQPVLTNAVYDVQIETLRFSTNIAAGNDVMLSGGPGGYKYQWFKDGSPLVDGNRISGSTTPDLVIRALRPSDFGTYSLQCGALSRYENAVWQLSVTGTNLTPNLRISGLRPFYSSPYLLDFNFFIRNTTNDNAATLDLAQLTNLVCKEDGQAISPSETGYRLMAENKQLECFVVLDYTMSMLNLTENGDQNGDSKSDSAEQMEAGAKMLIGALPRDAKIGLFEFHRGDAGYPPQQVTDLIRDKAYLTNQIDQIWTNVVSTSGSSRCWDALYLALQAFPTNNPGDNQRFLVFLSDGKDESSTNSPEDVIGLAQTNNVKICCIGYGNELNPTDLTNITVQTEGWYYTANSGLDLTAAFRQIGTNLSSQYILRWATLRRTDAEFTPSFQLTDLGLVATNPPYNPAEHQGDELQGHLWFDTCLNPGNVASLVLRASYVPRGVTRIRVSFATDYPFTIERIPFSEGGVCPDGWTFTTNLVTGGTNFFEFSSPTNRDPFTALPFATLGKLVEFKLDGVTDLKTCFSYLEVDNSLYSQPGGPSFTIDGPGAPSGGVSPPRIISFVAYTGPNSVRFEVVAVGDSLSYQWMWQGQDIPGATQSTLGFTNAQLTANAGYYSVRVFNVAGEVTSPPPGSLFQKGTPSGTYKGIFCDSENPAPETSGSFQFTLSGSKRTFSGKGLTGKTTFTFSGTFSEDHSAIVQTRKMVNGTPLTLQFQLLTTNDLPGIVGSVGNGSWTVPLRGYRAGYSSTEPAPQAGRYTLALQDLTTNLVGTIPNGCSFASVVVNRQGGVTMTGLTAEGTKFSFSSSLSKSGHWPLYVPLYKNQGCMIGWLQFTNTSDSMIQGESIFWVKNPGASTAAYPDGFSSSLQAIGSTFSTTAKPDWAWPPPSVVNVLPFTEAVASLAAGDMFSPDLSAPEGIWTFVSVSVPSANRLVAEQSPEKLRLSVTTGNGTLSGSFTHPLTGLRVPVRGVILQQQQSALGYFLSRNYSGYFALTPPDAQP